MFRRNPRVVTAILAPAALVLALWLLLFIGPQLLNAHRDDANVLALLIYLGVPCGLARGAARLWPFFDPEDPDNDGL